MPHTPEKFVIADDHPLFRAALKQSLENLFEHCQVIETESIDQLTALGEELLPVDLLLLDLTMPGAHGFSGLVFIRGQFPDLPVMVISANEEVCVMQQAIGYGASGFIPKSSTTETIETALRTVLAGEIYLPVNITQEESVENSNLEIAQRFASLTPHQYRVFNLLREGKLNKQIAYELNVSEATVKAHITPIFRKLNVSNRTQAVLLADRLAVASTVQFDQEAVD